MEVDETALAPFEVSRDEAKAKLKEQFGQMLATAKGGIMDALKSWRLPHPQQKSGSERKTFEADTKSTAPKSRTEDALDELEALLSQSTEQLQSGSRSARTIPRTTVQPILRPRTSRKRFKRTPLI